MSDDMAQKADDQIEGALRAYENMEQEIAELKDEVLTLKEDSAFLEALFACGVDNWDGYELAQGMVS